jgi:hypothetical protein
MPGSLRHFAEAFAPLAGRWAVWDNQTSPPPVHGGIADLFPSLTQGYHWIVMKNGKCQRKPDDFITPAQRAFRRVAPQLRAEHARLGLPLVLGEKGKVKLVWVR